MLDVDDCTFHNDVDADMGRDDDHVTLDNSNFDQDADFSGGKDDDDISLHSGNNFDRAPGIHRFEE